MSNHQHNEHCATHIGYGCYGTEGFLWVIINYLRMKRGLEPYPPEPEMKDQIDANP